MTFKTTICVLTPNGYYEEDGITIDLPFVPQQGMILRLNADQELLLEAKAKISKYKNEYITYWADKGDEYKTRDINMLSFSDYIYVLYVNYYVGTNELLIIMHSDPIYEN
jgi:hypothetical protein